jgi:hypothetical protein
VELSPPHTPHVSFLFGPHSIPSQDSGAVQYPPKKRRLGRHWWTPPGMYPSSHWYSHTSPVVPAQTVFELSIVSPEVHWTATHDPP